MLFRNQHLAELGNYVDQHPPLPTLRQLVVMLLILPSNSTPTQITRKFSSNVCKIQ